MWWDYLGRYSSLRGWVPVGVQSGPDRPVETERVKYPRTPSYGGLSGDLVVGDRPTLCVISCASYVYQTYRVDIWGLRVSQEDHTLNDSFPPSWCSDRVVSLSTVSVVWSLFRSRQGVFTSRCIISHIVIHEVEFGTNFLIKNFTLNLYRRPKSVRE